MNVRSVVEAMTKARRDVRVLMAHNDRELRRGLNLKEDYGKVRDRAMQDVVWSAASLEIAFVTMAMPGPLGWLVRRRHGRVMRAVDAELARLCPEEVRPASD